MLRTKTKNAIEEPIPPSETSMRELLWAKAQISKLHCSPVKLAQCFPVKGCVKGVDLTDTGIKMHYMNQTIQE